MQRLILAMFVITSIAGCCIPARDTEPPRKTFTRAQIRGLEGKTEADVLQMLGKPYSTSETQNRSRSFYYPDIVKDPVSERLGGLTIHFDPDGRVVSFNF